jgi:hypothetical protein
MRFRSVAFPILRVCPSLTKSASGCLVHPSVRGPATPSRCLDERAALTRPVREGTRTRSMRRTLGCIRYAPRISRTLGARSLRRRASDTTTAPHDVRKRRDALTVERQLLQVSPLRPKCANLREHVQQRADPVTDWPALASCRYCRSVISKEAPPNQRVPCFESLALPRCGNPSGSQISLQRDQACRGSLCPGSNTIVFSAFRSIPASHFAPMPCSSGMVPCRPRRAARQNYCEIALALIAYLSAAPVLDSSPGALLSPGKSGPNVTTLS